MTVSNKSFFSVASVLVLIFGLYMASTPIVYLFGSTHDGYVLREDFTGSKGLNSSSFDIQDDIDNKIVYSVTDPIPKIRSGVHIKVKSFLFFAAVGWLDRLFFYGIGIIIISALMFKRARKTEAKI